MNPPTFFGVQMNGMIQFYLNTDFTPEQARVVHTTCDVWRRRERWHNCLATLCVASQQHDPKPEFTQQAQVVGGAQSFFRKIYFSFSSCFGLHWLSFLINFSGEWWFCFAEKSSSISSTPNQTFHHHPPIFQWNFFENKSALMKSFVHSSQRPYPTNWLWEWNLISIKGSENQKTRILLFFTILHELIVPVGSQLSLEACFDSRSLINFFHNS